MSREESSMTGPRKGQDPYHCERTDEPPDDEDCEDDDAWGENYREDRLLEALEGTDWFDEE